MYCVQLPSRPTSFRSTSVKPYFWLEDIYDVELDKLKAPTKLDEFKAPAKLDELKASTRLDKPEAPLPTLEAL